MTQFLVMIEHGVGSVDNHTCEFKTYAHAVANDVEGAWRAVKRLYAKQGDTVSMGPIIKKCVPATHVDTEDE